MPSYPLISVEGVSLNDAAGRWGIDPFQPLRPIPARRNVSVAVPGRHGVLYPDVSFAEAGTFAVSLVVFGYGSTLTERQADCEKNMEALTYLFGKSLLTVDYYVDATTVRRATCRLAGSTEPEFVNTRGEGKVTFVLDVPDTWWRDVSYQSNADIVGGGAGGSNIYFPALADSVGPISDAVFVARGPFTSLTIRDMTSLQTLKASVTLANSSQYLQIDCGRMVATRSTSTSFDPVAGDDVTSFISTTGPGSATSWMNLNPQMVASDPRQRVVGIQLWSTPSTVAIKVRAKRSY